MSKRHNRNAHRYRNKSKAAREQQMKNLALCKTDQVEEQADIDTLFDEFMRKEKKK
jgi:hypothetical protein